MPTLGVAVAAFETPENCIACRGCERGDCTAEDAPITSHHCCPSSCLAHAGCVLATLALGIGLQPVAAMSPAPIESPPLAEPGPVFRPPRY
jgi:hypothetical protein